MLNEINLKDIVPEITDVTPIQAFLPVEIINEIDRFKLNKIDNLIIHGFPVPSDLPKTLKEIRELTQNSQSSWILKNIGDYLGGISAKGVENTIRFRIGDEGLVNEETWHGHYQYRFTVFYCLRGDVNAKTYFLSAEEIMNKASEKIRQILTTPYQYFPNSTFSLLKKETYGYSFAPEIYDRSDFEKYVKNLDLPDIIKALDKVALHVENEDARKALVYLVGVMKNSNSYICYAPGDVAMYRETSTIRFSPSYKPETAQENDRWLLAITVDN